MLTQVNARQNTAFHGTASRRVQDERLARHDKMGRQILTLKDEFPAFRGRPLHYFDSAATAQMPAVVMDAVQSFDTDYRANVHGPIHSLARQAIAAYQAARQSVASLLNAGDADEIIFTYGATSSINLLAACLTDTVGPGDEIVLSELEHHSNLIPWQQLARRSGAVLKFIQASDEGRLDLSALDRIITPKCRLVAVTHCSNVTGAITDVARIVDAARAVGSKVMLDGAQAAPHERVDVAALDIDYYVLSGHKLYGPTGIGVLWGKRDLLASLPPFMTGGQMTKTATLTEASFVDPPGRFEAGTPPIAAAIGLGAAAEWVMAQDWTAMHRKETNQSRLILDRLQGLPGVNIVGPVDTVARLGVISFTVDHVAPMDLCRHLDSRHVAIRYGDHCARPLLNRMGIDGAFRVSLAPYNDAADIDVLLDALETFPRLDAHAADKG